MIAWLVNFDWGTLGICVLIAVASSYLVWQVATGDISGSDDE